MKNQIRWSFTLVELLVVIAIIGVLSAIGLGVYSTAQSKSRNSATQSLIESVSKAFAAAQSEVGYLPAAESWQKLTFDEVKIKDSGKETTYFTTTMGDKKFQKALAKYLDAELVRRFLENDELTDSWGNPVYYRYPGIAKQTQCTILSAGADGKFGQNSKTSVNDVDSVNDFKSSGEWACDDVANF